MAQQLARKKPQTDDYGEAFQYPRHDNFKYPQLSPRSHQNKKNQTRSKTQTKFFPGNKGLYPQNDVDGFLYTDFKTMN